MTDSSGLCPSIDVHNSLKLRSPRHIPLARDLLAQICMHIPSDSHPEHELCYTQERTGIDVPVGGRGRARTLSPQNLGLGSAGARQRTAIRQAGCCLEHS